MLQGGEAFSKPRIKNLVDAALKLPVVPFFQGVETVVWMVMVSPLEECGVSGLRPS